MYEIDHRQITTVVLVLFYFTQPTYNSERLVATFHRLHIDLYVSRSVKASECDLYGIA